MTHILGINDIPEANFYERFSASKRKPLSLTETGAAYRLNNTKLKTLSLADELAVKESWWRAVLNVSSTGGGLQGKGYAPLPNLKMANWFEELKYEDSALKDFRITNNTEIKNAFLRDMDSWPGEVGVTWADRIGYTCKGELVVSVYI
jgi:hypothetical protein